MALYATTLRKAGLPFREHRAMGRTRAAGLELLHFGNSYFARTFETQALDVVSG